MYVTVTNDASYICRLEAETKPEGVRDGTKLIEVDTGKVFIFYKGTWYDQTPSAE